MSVGRFLNHREKSGGRSVSISIWFAEIRRIPLSEQTCTAKLRRRATWRYGIAFGVGANWKTACELRDGQQVYGMYYTKKDTGGLLDGEEGRELAAHNYGADKWGGS